MKIVPSKDNLTGADNEAVTSIRQTLATSTPASRPQELLRKVGDPEFNVYAMAYERGLNVSTFLELLDPTGQHDQYGGGQLDAFERLLRAAGVRCSTDPYRGIFANKLEDLESNRATKMLIPELLARFYRGATAPGAGYDRASPVFLSTDYIAGTTMRPWAQRAGVIQQPPTPQIPIASLIAITTGIDSDTYRGFYIDHDAEASRLKRVTEASELPRTRIKGREQTVNLYKYGRAVELSYEVMRRMAIDMVAILIQMMAAQAEADKLTDVVNVLINGDGNSNAITTHNLTTLDSGAVAGTLSLKGYINFQLQFESPYNLNVFLAPIATALQILMLNTGNSNLPLASFASIAGFGGVRPLNKTHDNIGLGWTSTMAALKIMGIDTGKALERVYEIGASVNEVDRFITRQVEVMTFSEVEGYAILDKNARRMLDVNA